MDKWHTNGDGILPWSEDQGTIKNPLLQNFGPRRIGRAAGADIVPELSSERRRRLLF